jgi:hypothetical protein
MATHYRELVIKGDAERFIDGFMAAKKIKSGVIVARRHPIQTRHLKEILTFRGDYAHVIVDARHHRTLVDAVREAKDAGFEMVSDTEITGAHFAFKFRVFNRDAGAKLKEALGSLPSGLSLTDYKPRETIDPSAHGVEMYSPVHEYTFEGKGTLRGDIEKLLDVRQRLSEHSAVEMKDIELERGAS